MLDFKPLEVLIFVHHWPTHSIAWEVWETDYTSLSDTPPTRHGESGFFEASDGSIYYRAAPLYGDRNSIDKYIRQPDTNFHFFTVIHLTPPACLDGPRCRAECHCWDHL